MRWKLRLLLAALALTIALLMSISCSTASVTASGDMVVMTQADLDELALHIERLTVERDMLRAVLEAERGRQDEYASQVKMLREAFDLERIALKNSANYQRRQKILWGVLGLGLGAAFVN